MSVTRILFTQQGITLAQPPYYTGPQGTAPSPSTDAALLIPTSIFTDRTLKVLEAVVEYLKESKGFTHHQIAALINRDDRTIWTVYHRVGLKRKSHIHVEAPVAGVSDALFFPSTVFHDRTLKVLEVVVEYLKEQKHLTYHQIAVLINRDDRTVWTVYKRAEKKRAAQKSHVGVSA